MQYQQYLSSPATIRLPAEIGVLSRRLKLSAGDLLGLAREVAHNGALYSPEQLTASQGEQLADLLRFLAQPCAV